MSVESALTALVDELLSQSRISRDLSQTLCMLDRTLGELRVELREIRFSLAGLLTGLAPPLPPPPLDLVPPNRRAPDADDLPTATLLPKRRVDPEPPDLAAVPELLEEE